MTLIADDIDIDDMQGVSREIYEYVGAETWGEICVTLGGLRIYIPKRIDKKKPSKICQLLIKLHGRAVTEEICRVFQGTSLSVPFMSRTKNRRRNLEICAAYDKGESVGTIAKKESLSQRHVQNILNGFSEKREYTCGVCGKKFKRKGEGA